MLQSINMLSLRQKAGQILDETYYRKDRFLIKRKNKPMAVLIPVEDYQNFFNGENIEIYTQKRIKEFTQQDKLSQASMARLNKILNK